ncbi:MAG: response regulator transcription factor [Ectothiorhodospiraceae bacterium]|nr:response regulator transcription factor [Ectothiorhodospiraceae bacterium]MCH8504376.1 response regulator [Ectothiorhodospiraceae bacterium]
MVQTETVYVVEDNAEVRESIAALLASRGLATRSYPDASSFLDDCDPLAAGCLVLDIRMPGASGLDLQRQMKTMGYSMPVVMITGHAEVPMAVRALKAGALDFIEKPFESSRLLDAVERGLSKSRHEAEKRHQQELLRARLATLTEREKQVLHHVAMGHYNKVIADELGIAISTVEVHRRRIIDKLQADSLYDLVRIADLDSR